MIRIPKQCTQLLYESEVPYTLRHTCKFLEHVHGAETLEVVDKDVGHPQVLQKYAHKISRYIFYYNEKKIAKKETREIIQCSV